MQQPVVKWKLCNIYYTIMQVWLNPCTQVPIQFLPWWAYYFRLCIPGWKRQISSTLPLWSKFRSSCNVGTGPSSCRQVSSFHSPSIMHTTNFRKIVLEKSTRGYSPFHLAAERINYKMVEALFQVAGEEGEWFSFLSLQWHQEWENQTTHYSGPSLIWIPLSKPSKIRSASLAPFILLCPSCSKWVCDFLVNLD